MYYRPTVLFFCVWTTAAISQTLPVPADPHELATNSIQTPTTPAARATAFSLLEQAKQNADMHMPGTPPFNIKISFDASGNVNFTGSGTITELWYSGRQWRYDQTLATYSETRIGSMGRIAGKGTNSEPLRTSMLRSAMFWPIGGNPSNSALRTAAASWNGRPVTCLLLSGFNNPPAMQGRLWEETEYCVDNGTGLLQIYSRAPGTYVVYSYAGNLQFHGRQVPDQIAIFVNGESVLTGQVAIKDADPAESAQTNRDSSMTGMEVNSFGLRFPMPVPAPGATVVKPVIVNATIDPNGFVAQAEISAASDPSLSAAALESVKRSNFGPSPSWRQAYINVRFGAVQ